MGTPDPAALRDGTWHGNVLIAQLAMHQLRNFSVVSSCTCSTRGALARGHANSPLTGGGRLAPDV